jgi:alpha-methylacyl-CoA racemase
MAGRGPGRVVGAEEQLASLHKPLSGIQVLDLALLLPGALAATWMADLGATVTRVEPPWGRGVLGGSTPGIDSFFTAMRSNKQLRRLNLRRENERAQLLALVRDADVLIEGFRPGALGRRGLDYQTLSLLNPRLIYCSVSGFGQSGPRRDEPGHDINYLSLASLLTPPSGSDVEPRPLPVQLADIGGGTYPALVAILAALFARERSGQGQHLDISIFDGTMAWNYFRLPLSRAAQGMGAPEDQEVDLGLLAGDALCYNIYQCADGRYLALGALEPFFWQNVCEVLERPDLLPYAANPAPGATERMDEFRAFFRRRPLDEWLERLSRRETLATPLLTLDEVLQDEHVHARGLIIEENGVPRVPFPARVQGFR